MKTKTDNREISEPVFDGTSQLCQAEISQLLAKAAIMCVDLDIEVASVQGSPAMPQLRFLSRVSV